MRKIVLLAVLIVSLSSCMRISHFDVKSVNDVKLKSMSLDGAEVVVDMTFESDKPIEFQISKFELAVSLNDKNIGTIIIPERTKIVTNDVGVKIPLSVKIEGGVLGAVTVLSRMKKDLDKAVVNGVIVVKKGMLKKKLKIKDLPIKDFYEGLSNDKIKMDGMTKFLKY